MTSGGIRISLAVFVVLFGAWACAPGPGYRAASTPTSAPTSAASDAPDAAGRPSGSVASSSGRPRYGGTAPAPVQRKESSQRIFAGTGKFIRPDPVRRAGAATEVGDGVSLNFIDANISDVVAGTLGDILGLNYAIDPNVTGSITVQTNQPLPREHLLPTLETILTLSGVAIVESDGFYSVVPVAAARRAGVPVRTPRQAAEADQGFGVQIVTLDYVPAAEMGRILRPIIDEKNLLRVDELRNLLILSGTRNEILGINEIIDIFDVDWMSGMSFGLFSLRYAEAADVAEELAIIFGRDRQEGLGNLVRLEPIERLNALLVVTQQSEYLQDAEVWIERLDQSTDGTKQRVFVYFVKNARADSLATALSEIFSGEMRREALPSGLAPGLEPVRIGTPEVAGPAARRVQPAQAGPAEGEGSADAAQPAPDYRAQPTGAPAEEGISLAGKSQARIIPDLDHNALIILATPREYQMIEATLQKLDIIPLQVLIEATIFEVTLNDTLEYGVQWFFRQTSGGDEHIAQFITSGVAPATPGFSYFFSGTNVDVVLNALREVTDVKLVASPQLMVLDNQSARIQVGDQVPIATQSAVSVTDAEAPVVNSIQFRDTGVILNVSPRVNTGGLVTLEVTQEVSSAIPTSTSTLSSPTIQQRSIQSTVAVTSGETVALGGLIQENQTKGVTGVPLLSDIPILGNLFKTTSDTGFRTELLVLITPRVVENELDAREVTDELRRRMGHVQEYITEYESGVYSPHRRSYDRMSDTAGAAAAPGPQDAATARATAEKTERAEPAAQPGTTPRPSAPRPSDEAQPAERSPARGAEIAAAPASRFVVHVASTRTEASAASEWRMLSEQMPSLLGGLTSYVHRAEIGALGTYYRVKAGPFESESSAQELCRRLAARGQYCQVMPLETAQTAAD